MLILNGVEIGNGMTEEDLAARRELLITTLAKAKRNGWREQLPKFKATPIQRVRTPAPKRQEIARSPMDLERMRRVRRAAELRRNEVRRLATQTRNDRIAAGLPVEDCPFRSNSMVRWDIAVGSWIDYRGRGGETTRALVIAHVPSGEMPPIPDGCRLRKNTKAGPSRASRYLLALPAIDALATPPVILATATEVERGIVKVHSEAPELERRPIPLRPGTKIQWVAQGQGCRAVRNGLVVAFIPAGTPVTTMGLNFHFKHQGGTQDASVRDRYLVESSQMAPGQRTEWSLPPAYLVERFHAGKMA